jgi:hypothetical protein
MLCRKGETSPDIRNLYYVRIRHSQLLLYKIAGTVIDHRENPLPNLIVECYNRDSEIDNYLGYTATDPNGQFELIFKHEPVKTTFKVNLVSSEISKAESTPDIHIVVRDTTKILYRSDICSNPAEFENFDVVIKEEITFSDPYANSFQREIDHILANVTAEVVDVSEVDPTRAAQHMIRIFGNLLHYSVLGVQLHGYPGPQVPRYPKRVSHNHSLPWNEKADHRKV